jgi:hypothetical protein
LTQKGAIEDHWAEIMVKQNNSAPSGEKVKGPTARMPPAIRRSMSVNSAVRSLFGIKLEIQSLLLFSGLKNPGCYDLRT